MSKINDKPSFTKCLPPPPQIVSSLRPCSIGLTFKLYMHSRRRRLGCIIGEPLFFIFKFKAKRRTEAIWLASLISSCLLADITLILIRQL